MKCPFCRESQTEVYNTRSTNFGTQIWRRRRCQRCSESFTTYERPDPSFLRIKRSSGLTERYSRPRLFAEVYNSFLNIKAKPETIDAVIDDIESKILDLKQDTIETNQISSIVLATLKHYNTPAFLRYLSSHAELSSSAELKRQLKKY